MRHVIKQLNDIFCNWSNILPLAGAAMELPSIYRHMSYYIETSFSSAEKEYLLRITNPKRRASSIAGRFAVRLALEKIDKSWLSSQDFVFPEILNNNLGKPYLTKHNDINISIAHSGSLAVAVVSSQYIGIDIEKNEARPESFIRMYFQNSEQNWINNKNINRNQRINCLWTRKEAVSKLLGVGGTIPFKHIKVLDNESDYVFYSYNLSNYCISLALEHEFCV